MLSQCITYFLGRKGEVANEHGVERLQLLVHYLKVAEDKPECSQCRIRIT